jgi:uridine phosphorylase
VHSLGPAHIADCVRFLAVGFGVRRFVSTGTVGGLGIGMGDIVVCNACSTQDSFSAAVFPGDVRRDEALGHVVEIDMHEPLAVSDRARKWLRDTFSCEIQLGPVFTFAAVSLEDEHLLSMLREQGFVALDLETGPFLAACRFSGAAGMCVHWVTDLPLERSFYYDFHGDPGIIKSDKRLKHRQWLNMPRLVLTVLQDLLPSISTKHPN